MRPDVLAARIDLRVCELKVLAAETFVRHGACPPRCFPVALGLRGPCLLSRSARPAATGARNGRVPH